MNYNYHTHTTRCGHASGTEEEYIQRAIANGIEYMGFSDHAPFIFPDGYQSSYRVPFDKVEDYMTTVAALRTKYQNQIDLKIGFEMEYYPTHFEKMLQNVRAFGAEYLILGQHFNYEEHPNNKTTGSPSSERAELTHYVDTVIEAIRTGVYTYVAHPDIFNFTGADEIYQEEMRRLCIASREEGIPMEINFLGIREGRLYPNTKFWQVAGQEKCPVTFGFDAHDTPSAYDGASLEKALQMVDTFQLNYIGKPRVRTI